MCRGPWAYVFRQFPCDVTRNLENFRDFQLDDVIKAGGTPSARAMKAFIITNTDKGYIKIVANRIVRNHAAVYPHAESYDLMYCFNQRPILCWSFERIIYPLHALRCGELA